MAHTRVKMHATTVDLVKRLPLEISIKITLLIHDYQTIKAWETYLPIIKGLPSVDAHRRFLLKKYFLNHSKCKCYRCWRQKCNSEGESITEYFRLGPKSKSVVPFYPNTTHDNDNLLRRV